MSAGGICRRGNSAQNALQLSSRWSAEGGASSREQPAKTLPVGARHMQGGLTVRGCDHYIQKVFVTLIYPMPRTVVCEQTFLLAMKVKPVRAHRGLRVLGDGHGPHSARVQTALLRR